MNQNEQHTFYVVGMHCESCVTLVSSELSTHAQVVSVEPNLAKKSVTICGRFEAQSPEELATELSKMLSRHALSVTEVQKRVAWNDFLYAIPIAIGLIALLIGLQRLGIVNIVQTETVTIGTAVVIGVIASLSTCMAVVGGYVLSLSASFAQHGGSVRPLIHFHLGRIISFFILGGAMGALGSVFRLGVFGTFILGVLLGIVMLVLGIHLLDLFHWTNRLQFPMPKILSQKAATLVSNQSLMPALLGAITFFLPCGFTQSMQFVALSTGSMLGGALTMLAFALGTLPVLALISFSSFRITNSRYAGVFFKTVGLIVIAFALFNIMNALTSIGWIQPVIF